MIVGLIMNVGIHIPFLLERSGFIVVSSTYLIGYIIIFQICIVFGLIPFGALSFFTTMLLVAVHRQTPSAHDGMTHTTVSPAQKKDTRDVTVVVIAIFVVFILTNLPWCIYGLTQMLEISYIPEHQCGSAVYLLKFARPCCPIKSHYCTIIRPWIG